VADASHSPEGASNCFDHFTRGGDAARAFGNDDSSVDFDFEAPGVAANQDGLDAQRISQRVSGSGGLRQVVASDTEKNGDHGCRALALAHQRHSALLDGGRKRPLLSEGGGSSDGQRFAWAEPRARETASTTSWSDGKPNAPLEATTLPSTATSKMPECPLTRLDSTSSCFFSAAAARVA